MVSVLAQLRRLDERFGTAPRGLRLRQSDRSALLAAISEQRTEDLDPALVHRGRSWARTVLSRRTRSANRALVGTFALMLAVGLLLMAFEGREWVVFTAVGASNLPLQLVILRAVQRQARTILDALPPSPHAPAPP